MLLLEFPKVLEQPLKKEGGKAKSGARNNACKSEAISGHLLKFYWAISFWCRIQSLLWFSFVFSIACKQNANSVMNQSSGYITIYVVYVRGMLLQFASQIVFQRTSVCIRISLIEIYFKCSRDGILYKQLRVSDYWENNSGRGIMRPVFYYPFWHHPAIIVALDKS